MTSVAKHRQRAKRTHDQGYNFGLFTKKAALKKQKKENTKGFVEAFKSLIRTGEK